MRGQMEQQHVLGLVRRQDLGQPSEVSRDATGFGELLLWSSSAESSKVILCLYAVIRYMFQSSKQIDFSPSAVHLPRYCASECTHS